MRFTALIGGRTAANCAFEEAQFMSHTFKPGFSEQPYEAHMTLKFKIKF
jgi:hypothetical protein